MNDPHVAALHYTFLSSNPADDWSKTPPYIGTLGDFDIELKESKLVATPKGHYATELEAKEVLDPLLDGWKETALLDFDHRMSFVFTDSDIIDRKPTPGVSHVKSAVCRMGAYDVTPLRHNNNYPTPDPHFASSLLTSTMARHYREYREGRARIASMGYAVLNAIEVYVGKIKPIRENAAQALNIDKEVLLVLGDLTAVEDSVHGRKYKTDKFWSNTLQSRSLKDPLTPKERRWIEKAVVMLIRRVGHYNSNPVSLPLLEMKDLPSL